MIYDDLIRDAEFLANSEQGIQKLVRSLLSSLISTEEWFISALRKYVYYKRCREITLKTLKLGRRQPRSIPYLSDFDVYESRQRKNEAAGVLIKETNAENFFELQKEWGKILSVRYEFDTNRGKVHEYIDR